MMPLFSATKTRPSGENRTAVGRTSPRKTTVSSNPLIGLAELTAPPAVTSIIAEMATIAEHHTTLIIRTPVPATQRQPMTARTPMIQVMRPADVERIGAALTGMLELRASSTLHVLPRLCGDHDH